MWIILSHYRGLVYMLILDMDDGYSPPRVWMMMLGGRCFMMLLMFPSDLVCWCH
jgi:hypothetical protein